MLGAPMSRPDPIRPPRGAPLVRMAVLTLTACLVGAAASLAAIVFLDLVELLNDALLVSPWARVQHDDAPWLVAAATVSVPALGGLLVGLLLRHLSPARRQLGPPDVIAAVQLQTPLPDWRSGIAASAAAVLSLGAGASVGQYGPMVYLGAMAGGLAGRVRWGVANLPTIAVACGVGAAISTAFNAPLAGLVFVREVVLRHNSTQAFAPVAVACVTGYVINAVILEREPLFLVDFAGVESGYEFGLFAGLGLLAAAAAIGYMRLLILSAGAAARSGLPPALRPAAAGLALGVTALWLPDVLGIGTEALRFATIEGAFAPGELLLLMLAKIALTALCLGWGFAGGVFSPALLIGALLGALFWTGVAGVAAIPTSGIAVYAISGMMAVASAVIGAPLTCILIVFELTRNYDITIAATLAVVFSNLVSHWLFGRSLFDVELARRGIDLSVGRDRARMATMPVIDHASDDFVRATSGTPRSALDAALAAAGRGEAFVVDGDGRFVGVYRPAPGGGAGPVEAAAVAPAVRFDETTSVTDAMQLLLGFVGDAVPVVQSDTGRLLGVVPEAAVIEAYLDTSRTLREEENAAL